MKTNRTKLPLQRHQFQSDVNQRGGFAKLIMVIALAIAFGFIGSYLDYQRNIEGVQENFLVKQSSSVIDAVVVDPETNDRSEVGLTRFPVLEVVGGDTYDFGFTEKGVELEHTFVIRNDGNEPLELRLQGVTCRCLSMGLEKDDVTTILPGDTFDVTLKWRSDKDSERFEQQARIKTNDPHPRRGILKLKVIGKIVSPIRAMPDQLGVDNVVASASSRFSFNLYFFDTEQVKAKDITIKRIRCDDPTLEERLKFDWSVLSEEELRLEDKSGHGYLVVGEIPRGMPMNNYSTVFTVETSDGTETMVRFSMKVKAPVSIRGLVGDKENVRFFEEAKLIDFGLIKANETAELDLILFYRTDEKDLKVELDPVVPEGVLDVKLNSVQANANGAMARLSVKVPQDCPTVQLSGPDKSRMAKITLKSTSKEAPEISLYVSFSKE